MENPTEKMGFIGLYHEVKKKSGFFLYHEVKKMIDRAHEASAEIDKLEDKSDRVRFLSNEIPIGYVIDNPMKPKPVPDLYEEYRAHPRFGGWEPGLLTTATCGLDNSDQLPQLAGEPKVVAQLNAVLIVPRTHKKRRSQSEQYHRRITKKWAKRAKTDPKFQEATQPVQVTLPPAVMQIVEALR